MSNAQRLVLCTKLLAKLIRYEAQYTAAKIVLANNEEVDIPPAKITALKQAFAADRAELISQLQAITA